MNEKIGIFALIFFIIQNFIVTVNADLLAIPITTQSVHSQIDCSDTPIDEAKTYTPVGNCVDGTPYGLSNEYVKLFQSTIDGDTVLLGKVYKDSECSSASLQYSGAVFYEMCFDGRLYFEPTQFDSSTADFVYMSSFDDQSSCNGATTQEIAENTELIFRTGVCIDRKIYQCDVNGDAEVTEYDDDSCDTASIPQPSNDGCDSAPYIRLSCDAPSIPQSIDKDYASLTQLHAMVLSRFPESINCDPALEEVIAFSPTCNVCFKTDDEIYQKLICLSDGESSNPELIAVQGVFSDSGCTDPIPPNAAQQLTDSTVLGSENNFFVSVFNDVCGVQDDPEFSIKFKIEPLANGNFAQLLAFNSTDCDAETAIDLFGIGLVNMKTDECLQNTEFNSTEKISIQVTCDSSGSGGTFKYFNDTIDCDSDPIVDVTFDDDTCVDGALSSNSPDLSLSFSCSSFSGLTSSPTVPGATQSPTSSATTLMSHSIMATYFLTLLTISFMVV